MASSQPPPPRPAARTARTYPTIVLNRWIPSVRALQQVVAAPPRVIPLYSAGVVETAICGRWILIISVTCSEDFREKPRIAWMEAGHVIAYYERNKTKRSEQMA